MGNANARWQVLGEPDPDSVKHEEEMKQKAQAEAAKRVNEPVWELRDKDTGYVLETASKPRDLEWVKVK